MRLALCFLFAVYVESRKAFCVVHPGIEFRSHWDVDLGADHLGSYQALGVGASFRAQGRLTDYWVIGR